METDFESFAEILFVAVAPGNSCQSPTNTLMKMKKVEKFSILMTTRSKNTKMQGLLIYLFVLFCKSANELIKYPLMLNIDIAEIAHQGSVKARVCFCFDFHLITYPSNRQTVFQFATNVVGNDMVLCIIAMHRVSTC